MVFKSGVIFEINDMSYPLASFIYSLTSQISPSFFALSDLLLNEVICLLHASSVDKVVF